MLQAVATIFSSRLPQKLPARKDTADLRNLFLVVTMVRFTSFVQVLFVASAAMVAGEDLGKINSLVEKATTRFLQLSGLQGATCMDPGFDSSIDENFGKIMSTIVNADGLTEGIAQYEEIGVTVGSTTALIPEAADAAVSGATIEDGMSGDIDFPHGKLKPIATVGERSICGETYGEKIVGHPDGCGAYLVDDSALRVIVQSEGYGPIRGFESCTFPANDGTAHFGGSHIQFVDCNREDFATFMAMNEPASSMVIGFGEMIEKAYNLKGEPVGPRNGKNETAMGAHYGNTDEKGVYVAKEMAAEGDWFFQSLCSAHLEQKHQWGEGIGMEDNIFITNEEWMAYDVTKEFVGLSTHVLDIATKSLYAVGVFTNGGFEKSVEINSKNPGYVMCAVSGCNGAYDDKDIIPQVLLDKRNEEYGPRPDGKNCTWPKDIVPHRIYVGLKGKLEDGSDAPEDDFLARNGFKHGQLYGFAINMTESGPTGGVFRDEWHKNATNGDSVTGKWIAQPWRWNGEVRNFQHDGAWDCQHVPPGGEAGGELEGFLWWNSNGYDAKGCKTEHLSPDPRAGNTAFVQGSTCGYFGHAYVQDVDTVLAAANGGFPDSFDGSYHVYQGETDITAQIELGGKGQHTQGRDATRNWDSTDGEGKVTFEDIDGLEVLEAADGNLYVVLQEDSGSKLGERMFISGPLEHESDGNDLTYYLVAVSGGAENSRQVAGVGIPAGSMCFDGEKFESDANEFSGVFDLSGLLVKDELGNFAMTAADDGASKRLYDSQVAINDKYVLLILQAKNMKCGLVETFQADRGGQWLLYQPDLPIST